MWKFICTSIALFTCSISLAQDSTSRSNAGDSGILDSLLALLIILFILSIITEKITQLIRKYSPFIRPHHILHKTPLTTVWRNIRKHQKDSTKMDDRIAREINSLSFVLGLMIAMIFCIDLFKMVKASDPRTTLYWTETKWNEYIYAADWYLRVPLLLVSFSLTGFFLTFGSKFFHDLIDTLLQVKNLKRKMVDERTYREPQSITELVDFINTPEMKLAQISMEQNGSSIKTIKGVLSVGPGYMTINGEKTGCLEIHVDKEQTMASIDSMYPVKLQSGLHVKIPTNVIITGDYPRAASGAGAEIANSTQALGFGTLGGIVQDKTTKEKYILSCHHVLNGEANWKGLSSSRSIVLRDNGQLKPVAELSYGFRTREYDTALATIKAGVKITNATINNPDKIRKVEANDAINETKITVLGAITGKQVTGFVYNDSWDTEFYYPTPNGGEELWPLKDVIVLTRRERNFFKPVSQPGDSGALVMDLNRNVIGMIVGGDDFFSYAIKMDKIAETFNIELA